MILLSPTRFATPLLALLLLAGCGSSNADGGGAGTAAPGASGPSTSQSSTNVASPPSPFEIEAQRRATAAYPPKAQMPAGWIQVDPTAELPSYPGDPVYCGVALEPETARGSALHMYQASDSGPYALQYTYVLTPKVATTVMSDLDQSVRQCIASGRDDKGRVFAAKQAPTVGEESVSVAFVADAGAVSQVTVFRRGEVIVAVVGSNPAGMPPLKEISAIATAVDEQLADS